MLSSGLVLIAAMLGVLTQSLLAASLGLSDRADAFFAAFAVATITSSLFHTTVLNRTIPRLAERLDPTATPTADFWHFAWGTLRRILALAVVVAAALFLAAEGAIGLIAPGMPAETRALATLFLRVIVVALTLDLTASVLVAVQFAAGRQPSARAVTLLYSAAMITSLVMLGPRIGPIAAPIGTAAGYALMFVGYVFATWTLRRGTVSTTAARAGPLKLSSIWFIGLTSALGILWGFVDQMIASTLAEGTIAQVAFAFRPIDVLLRALPSVIGYAAMPAIAAAYARDHWEEVQHLEAEALRLVSRISLPLAALVIAVREPLVEMLYQRAAFSAENAASVAATLGWYAGSFLSLSLMVMLNVIFLATGRARLAASMSGALLLIQAPLGLVLGRLYGGSGIALGLCISSTLVAAGAIVVIGRRNVPALLQDRWFHWTLGTALAVAAFAQLGVQLTRGLPAPGPLAAGLSLGGTAGLLVLLRARDPFVAGLFGQVPLLGALLDRRRGRQAG